MHAGIAHPPPLWTEWQTGVKILPYPKLRLRAVNMAETALLYSYMTQAEPDITTNKGSFTVSLARMRKQRSYVKIIFYFLVFLCHWKRWQRYFIWRLRSSSVNVQMNLKALFTPDEGKIKHESNLVSAWSQASITIYRFRSVWMNPYGCRRVYGCSVWSPHRSWGVGGGVVVGEWGLPIESLYTIDWLW